MFFVAIPAFSLFILCLFFLEGEKRGKRKNDVDKKIPFHPKIARGCTESVKREYKMFLLFGYPRNISAPKCTFLILFLTL